MTFTRNGKNSWLKWGPGLPLKSEFYSCPANNVAWHFSPLTCTYTDWLIDWLVYWWIIDWLIDGLVGWLTDWLTDWRTDWLTDWLTDGLTDWLTDWLTHWLIDWLNDWFMDNCLIIWLIKLLMDWLVDWLIDWLTDWFIDWLNMCCSSGWVPLLLALMYEFSNSESFWKPYLDLTPDVTTLDQPLFWSAEERQVQLTGTGIEEDVENDVQHLEEEYRTIVVPFMRKNSKYFKCVLHDLDCLVLDPTGRLTEISCTWVSTSSRST